MRVKWSNTLKTACRLKGWMLNKRKLSHRRNRRLERKNVVKITFADEEADKFAGIRVENDGGSLAILLNGELISIPTIQSEITSSKCGVLSLYGDVGEMQKLVDVLN